MSTIINTEPMEDGQIMVTVEGYPHAQPVFADTLTGQVLQDAVDAWAINQDEVDSLNNGTATQALLDRIAAENVIKQFSPNLVRYRMSQDFARGRIKQLSPYLYAIHSFLEVRNFTQLKQLLEDLITDRDATQGDYNTFRSIILEQGIDIDNY